MEQHFEALTCRVDASEQCSTVGGLRTAESAICINEVGYVSRPLVSPLKLVAKVV
jgi:hypothetical protein